MGGWLSRIYLKIRHLENIFKIDVKIVRDVGVVFFIRMLSFALGFVSNVIIARALGPAYFGDFKVMVSIALFLLPFFDFGVFASLGFLIANTTEKTLIYQLITAGYVLCISIGILYAISFVSIGIIASNFLKTATPLTPTMFIICSPLVITMPFQLLVPQLAQGLGKPKLFSTFYLFNSVIFLLFVILAAILKKLSVLNASLSLFGANFITSGIFVWKILSIPHLNFNKTILKRISQTVKSYGIKLYLGYIATTVVPKFDAFILALFRSSYEVGIYNVALPFSLPIVTFSQILGIAVFRRFVNDTHVLKKVEFLNYMWLVVTNLGLLVMGRFFIITFWGKQYLDAVKLLPFVALLAFFQGGYYIRYSLFSAKGYAFKAMIASFITSGIQFITMWIFAYIWGSRGILIASLLAYFLFWIILYFFSKELSRTKKIKSKNFVKL